MRNGMKQLGLGVLLALGTSSAALALPPQCTDICPCAAGDCTEACYNWLTPTTCGAYGECGGVCMANVTPASLSQDSSTQQSQEQQDASQDVCIEPA